MYNESLFPDEILFETLTDSPNVLFDQPKELKLIHLTKRPSDVNAYTITLYTNTFYISTDKRSIYINNDEFQPDKYVYVTNDVLTLYLHDRTFIKGTVKIKTEYDILNEIIDENNESKDENSQVDIDANQSEAVPYKNTSLDNLGQVNNYEQIDITQSDVQTITTSSEQTVPFKNSDLDNCSVMLTQCEITKSDKIKETEQCIGALQQCTIDKSNLEQKHTDYDNRILNIQQEHNRDNERASKTCIDTINHWTNEKQLCDKREHECKKQKNDLKIENEELKKQIGKKSNGSQSTPNSIIIICVLIIIFLLGLCIFLYFRTPLNV
jgi:hypothetical protein